jgi:hypothetical protein
LAFWGIVLATAVAVAGAAARVVLGTPWMALRRSRISANGPASSTVVICFVADVEGFEDGLVDEPADAVVASQVEVVEVVADDLQGVVEGLGDVAVAEVQAGDERLGVAGVGGPARRRRAHW